jgi:uncharacterized protein (TIGR03546 family)
MFWLTIVRDFLKLLRAAQDPRQIAGGFALGSILGLSPMLTLQGVVIWLVILVLNVNISAAILAITLCSLIAYIFDPFFHWLGYVLLVNVDGLHGFWTWLYNAPIAPLTRFNNTVVMGSLVVALILVVPIYVGTQKFVLAYRTHIGSKIEKWKIYQILSKSSLVKLYQRVRDLKG